MNRRNSIKVGMNAMECGIICTVTYVAFMIAWLGLALFVAVSNRAVINDLCAKRCPGCNTLISKANALQARSNHLETLSRFRGYAFPSPYWRVVCERCGATFFYWDGLGQITTDENTVPTVQS